MVKDVENSTDNGCKEEDDVDAKGGPQIAFAKQTSTAEAEMVVLVVGV